MMNRHRNPLAIALATSIAGTAVPSAATATCDGDTCQAAHSGLLAIAHDHNDYADSILYRVTLPEQATGTNWGDGSNGFFYRVKDNLGQSYQSIVPFNGIGVDAEGAPALRPFSFIVKAPTTATQISVQACASNYVADGDAAKCSKLLWTDTYATLPSPSVGAPSGFPSTLTLEYLNNAVSVRNNGVYGARVLLEPSAGLTEAQIDWLYDHLVFLDAENDVYTNNVLADSTASPSFAALSIEQAAHPTKPSAATYNTKYGQVAQAVTPNDPSETPNRYLWVYSTNVSYVGSGQSIPVGVGWLYDASTGCPGALSGDDNSKASSCSVPAPTAALGSGNATLDLTVLDGSDVSVQGQSQHAAGTRFVRTLDLSVGGTHDLCTAPVNPLAINAASGINLPNYVIDRRTASGSDPWAKAFPAALYYVLPTGFGNCAGDEAPFCQLTNAYTAYVPGYLDQNGLGGPLNGNSTPSPLLGSTGGTFKLFDQYKLDGLAETASNTLVWFDNCGYGHLYQDDSLTARLSLPPAKKPDSLKVLGYRITNDLDQAVVFAKDCCASLYQENTNDCTQQQDGTLTDCAYDPPQQIGSSIFEPELAGSGLYVPAGASVSYSTLFSDELTTAYNAATGLPLFKLRLMAGVSAISNAGTSVLFGCADPGQTVLVTPSETAPKLEIGGTGTGSIGCSSGIGTCPWPMAAAYGTGSLSGYMTCTLGHQQQSSSVLGVDEWAKTVLTESQPVLLLAWGAEGDAGPDKSGGSGGKGGAGGFASTVVTGSELMRTPALYGYVGNRATGYSTLGGSSSILAKVPLSALDVDELQTLTPSDHVYLIGGGGGGGGDASDDAPWHVFDGGGGGSANKACANASAPLPGPAVSATGSNGTGGGGDCGVGKGGNPNGKGYGGSSTGTGAGGRGIGGWGWSNQWRSGGSLVFVNTPAPSSGVPTGRGVSSANHGGAGAGGWGGGGSGDSCSGSGAAGSGAGGGGTFAAGNTAHDENAPSGGTSCEDVPPAPSSPSPGGYGAIMFAFRYPCTSPLCLKKGDLKPVGSNGGDNCVEKGAGKLLASGQSYLSFTADGDLVLAQANGDQLWHSNTANKGVNLCFWSNAGDMSIHDANGDIVWGSDSTGVYLIIRDCTVQMIDADGKAVWSEDHDSSCG